MPEYRVDDLARATDTSVRNIRVYQDRGLLPPPRREGRVAYYNDDHVARLRLVGRLLDRGYTLATIRDLFDAWSAGHDLADVLGLEGAISAPWTDELPTYVTAADIQDRFGPGTTPSVVERAVVLGLIEPSGSVYRVPSRKLFEAGADLVATGMPVSRVLDLSEALQSDLAVVARRLLAAIGDRMVHPDSRDLMPPSDQVPEVVELVEKLRPHAQATAEALLARALTAETDRLFRRFIDSVRPIERAGDAPLPDGRP